MSEDRSPSDPLSAPPPADEPLWTERPPIEQVQWVKPLPARSAPAPSPGVRWLWLVALGAALWGVRYGGPRLAEEVQYSLTRGQQRAEYEMAGLQLQELPLEQLSQVSHLVSQRVAPSVVHINTSSGRGATQLSRRSGSSQDLPSLEELDPHPGLAPEQPQGQGSGVIVDADGYIVTNAHVIMGSDDITVKLSDGRVVPADVIGSDILTDLAVLRVEAPNLIAADWGDSSRLHVGSLVWAVGSPFGLDHSITLGILSGKNRGGMAGTPHQDFLQTDAAVNPGNSGGPLVDAQGHVVGINTAIVGQVYQGISFAIPSSVAQQVYQRLRANGQIVRGWLGVQPEEIPGDLAQRPDGVTLRGAYVAWVVDEQGQQASPAKRAGIRAGDVVVRWNGQIIESPTALFSLVGMTEVGSTVPVVVWRDGQEVTLEVDVVARPE